MNCKDYFDSVAQRYLKTRSSLLGWLMRREESALMKLLDVRSGELILDAGCGPGHYANKIQELGAKVIAVDFSPLMVSEALKSGVKAKVADVESMRLPEKFDKILCAGVLEFCTQPGDAIANLARHLKGGGCLVLLFPRMSVTGALYWLYHCFHGFRIKFFSVDEIASHLARVGMVTAEIESPGPFSVALRAIFD